MDQAGNITQPNLPKSSPDHILVQGSLSSGAVASLSFRTNTLPVDDLGLRWLISGTDGEIELTAPSFAWTLDTTGTTLKVRYRTDKDVEIVDIEDKYQLKGVEGAAKNVARVYEAFWKREKDLIANFEDALVRHRLIDAVRKSAAEGGTVKI